MIRALINSYHERMAMHYTGLSIKHVHDDALWWNYRQAAKRHAQKIC